MTRIITHLDEVADRYDAVFCDLWGCLHNGVAPFPAAVAALEAFKARGGYVMLLTNAPRPAPSVAAQLDQLGVPRTLYHGITASGDAARAAMASGLYGTQVFHLGPKRDEGFFQGVSEEEFYQGTDIARVPLDQAEGIICTGLFDDETETPETYRAMFLDAKSRGLKMLCANPDVIVDRGERRIYCAGALAELYTQMGGEAHAYGKPHAPIYALAHQRLATLAGTEISPKRILCIGDGINTDIRGAVGENLDSLFITGGLAATETATKTQPDPTRLDTFLTNAQLSPTYAAGFLR